MRNVYDKNGVEIHNGDFLLYSYKLESAVYAVVEMRMINSSSICVANNDYQGLYAVLCNNYNLENTCKISEEEYLQYLMEE
jgi:hypothetical protein